MLQSFGQNLWLADGPLVTAAAGFHYPTRMAVIRLASGGLFLWSPVAPTDAIRTGIDQLGPVCHLVAPNKLHNLFLAPWKAVCPKAMVHAAPGLRERRPELSFDADLSASPHPAWAGEIAQVLLPNRIADELVFLHHDSGTVLFTDLLQGLPKDWFSGWRALVAKLDGMTGPEAAVPHKFRLASTNRKALREGLRTILDWPARQVVMAHGTPVTTDAPAFLARAFAWARP